MKFKTLFQRRPASSNESDGMTGTTKRKKKESKPLTTTMKPGAGTKTTTTTNAAFITIAPPTATAKEKLSSSCAESSAAEAASSSVAAVAESDCTTASKNGGGGAITAAAATQFDDEQNCHHCQQQPQPEGQSENIIRFNCESCCGRKGKFVDGLVGKVDIMKLPEESPKNAESMEAENKKLKLEVEQYKKKLEIAHQRIHELTEEVTKMKVADATKSAEFEELHHDFLLCMRSAERFRNEADLRAEAWKIEVVNLRKEVRELKGEKLDNRYAKDDGTSASSLSDDIVPKVKLPAPAWKLATKNGRDGVTTQKPIKLSEDALNPDKVEKVMQKVSPSRKREEKLAALRKNCHGSVRNGLLRWCQLQTRPYTNVEITNFSTSWSNGLALAALVHSIDPDAFDYDLLQPGCPVDNFETALQAAKKLGVDKPLNVIKLVNESENPPWEPIVAYVTEIYIAAPTPTI